MAPLAKKVPDPWTSTKGQEGWCKVSHALNIIKLFPITSTHAARGD